MADFLALSVRRGARTAAGYAADAIREQGLRAGTEHEYQGG
jgi:hypothetical protein